MAKKKNQETSQQAVTVTVGPKLANLTFVIMGDLKGRTTEKVIALIESEGGRVADKVAKGVDYLVVGRPKRGDAYDVMKKERNRHKSLGETLQIVDDAEFHRLFQPTRDEAIALLAGGPEGRARWNQWTLNLYSYSNSQYYEGSPEGLDLSGVDFRGADLRGVDLDCAKLEGNDFSGADLSEGRFSEATNCKFDRATLRDTVAANSRDCSFRDADLREGVISHAEGCTFDGARLNEGGFSEDCKRNSVKHVDLSDARLNPVDLSESDLTGSKLCRVTASYTVATDAVFREANLVDAEFDKSQFKRADFTGADLSKACLRDCDFTGAILRKARLVQADLRGAILADADLTGADLREAILADADLRGATIDGADFERANVFGAKLDRLAPEEARNLVVVEKPSGNSFGPRVRELAKLARSLPELRTWAKLDLPGGATVSLSLFSWSHGSNSHRVDARYWHIQGELSRNDFIESPRLEVGMMFLANLWKQGQLRPDGIKVEARKCSLRGAALLELATAAWREALGLPALSSEEFRRQQKAQEADREARREALIEELRGGRDGVAAWNARPSEQRCEVGPLRRVDLAGAELSGADLTDMDFSEARLDGARLVGADLNRNQLKGASFRNADLTEATFYHCKGTRANFEGATLVKSNLNWTVLQRANLRNSNLESARLSSADLRGADLTGAHLAGADLSYASYNELTRLPSNFDPPATMRWTGKGKAPGTKPPKASKGKTARRRSS